MKHTMITGYRRIGLCLICLVWLSCRSGIAQHGRERPNVLFICLDDMRPDLHCYGNTLVHSPNMDRLAAEGMLFTRHFAAVPTCGASRAAILTGMYPRTRADLSNDAAVHSISGKPRTERPETFIDQLRRNGYYTVGISKISHYPDGYIYDYLAPKSDRLELPYSWDEMLFDPGRWGNGWNAFFGYADGSDRNHRHNQVKPYEAADVDDEGYPDGLTARLAVKKIHELAGRDQPFFLAVGFLKPHLPFNAPRKYWDLYDESAIPLTPSPGIPENVNKASLMQSGEFNSYRLGDEAASLQGPVSDAYARKLRHAYYACISYTDAQVGKVLAALRETGQDRNTIVILWSDHGWHLGDDLVWGKHTLFDWALRNILIVKVPGQKGGICDQVVSSIDIYPTLLKLCGVPMPFPTDGQPFNDLLSGDTAAGAQRVAYSYFNRGISVRTGRYRLTRYYRQQPPTLELYDHLQDPYENRNVAADHPDVVRQLLPLLEKAHTDIYAASH